MLGRAPARLGPDRLLIPMPAYGPDGERGDGAIEIGPDDPPYEQWAERIDSSAYPSAPIPLPDGGFSGRPRSSNSLGD